MKLQEHISGIEGIFKDIILEGDYDLVSCGDCTATIMIEGKHILELWIANDPKNHFDVYKTSTSEHESSLINIKFNNEKERLKGYRQIKKKMDIYKRTILKRQKRAELNRLMKEVAKLEEDER